MDVENGLDIRVDGQDNAAIGPENTANGLVHLDNIIITIKKRELLNLNT
jgi:hypothetical protein